MKFRRLGSTGLQVSEIGLGCNNFGVRTPDQDQVNAVVRAALDAGITLFDTADVYGAGKSEGMLGAALGATRKDVVLATKFAVPTSPGPYGGGGSRRYVVRAVEASLRRLGTDHIDLLQMHFPDPQTPIEETLRALDDLITAGKVLYVGSANFRGWQIADAEWTARTRGFNGFASAQNNYSLLERSVEEEVLPACEHFGLGFLPYFPLAAGLLSGKYRRGEPPSEGTRLAGWDAARLAGAMSERNLDTIEALSEWAKERGHTLLELAFAWLLGHSVVSSVIAGATNAEQVDANAAAAGWVLSAADISEVSALVDANVGDVGSGISVRGSRA
jgi:aryl-alcohol dehydrogenase-like predicted oxidoreductase